MFCLALVSCHLANPIPPAENDLRESLRQYSVIAASNPLTSSEAQQARLNAALLYYHEFKEIEKALQIFQKIIDLRPTSSQAGIALLELAEHHFQAQNYTQSRTRYLQFALDFANDSQIARAKKRIADCLFHQNLFDQALDAYQDYQHRFTKTEKEVEVLLRVAEIYQNTDQTSLARRTYLQVLRDFPERRLEIEPILVALGGITAKGNQKVMSDAPLQMTDADSGSLRRQTSEAGVGPLSRPNAQIEINSWKSSTVFKHNARTLLEESGMLEVGEVRDSLIGNGVLLDDVVMNLGQRFFMIGDHLKAGACLEKTVALGIQKSDVYLQLGVCYKKAKAWDLAGQTFAKLAKVDPAAIQSLIDDAASKLDSQPAYARKSLQVLVGISRSTDLVIQQIQPDLILLKKK